MKSMLRKGILEEFELEYSVLYFVCPGCIEMYGGSGLHTLPVNTEVSQPSWEWDGNLEAPTLSPSILTGKNDPEHRCHSFLRGGIFEFLADCSHSLAGQYVPMPDLPDWVVKEIIEKNDEKEE